MQPTDSVYRFAIDRLKHALADRLFLSNQYTDLDQWKAYTRIWIDGLLHYGPDPVPSEPTVEEKPYFGSYTRQKLSFSTAKDCRVLVYLLLPKLYRSLPPSSSDSTTTAATSTGGRKKSSIT
jgi:hypothetical protein